MWQTIALLLFSPLLVFVCAVVFALEDLVWMLFGKRRIAPDIMPRTIAASVVIPNWNGKDLLEKYIPSIVTALEGNPDNEIIVVDNGSSDGSADYLRSAFPNVRTLALPERTWALEHGSNAGFAASRRTTSLSCSIATCASRLTSLLRYLQASRMRPCLPSPARST